MAAALAEFRELPITAVINDAMIAMIMITTRISTSVNPSRRGRSGVRVEAETVENDGVIMIIRERGPVEETIETAVRMARRREILLTGISNQPRRGHGLIRPPAEKLVMLSASWGPSPSVFSGS